jgi:hypothetical protein
MEVTSCCECRIGFAETNHKTSNMVQVERAESTSDELPDSKRSFFLVPTPNSTEYSLNWVLITFIDQ